MEQKFIQKAIDLAYDRVKNHDGEPYGAIVVKDGVIVGTGTNVVATTKDPTAHAEIEAVREACKRLNTTDLSDCVVYASGEPCPMCLAAIYWTGVQTVYFAYAKQASGKGVDSGYIYEQIALPIEQRAIRMEQVANPEPEKDPMALYKQKNAR